MFRVVQKKPIKLSRLSTVYTSQPLCACHLRARAVFAVVEIVMVDMKKISLSNMLGMVAF